MMRKLIPLVLRIIPRPWLIRMSYRMMWFTSLLYHGDQVECPVCGGRFRKFLPYGYNRVRQGVLCPRCFSLERHRLLWLFLQRRSRFFTDQLKVLHIAPEQCFHSRFRKMDNLDYVTADLVSPLADVKTDVQNMEFPDALFDVVICNHVLEHVPDDRRAMREIRRILNPGGFAILQVPANHSMEKTYEDASITDPAEREKHFRQRDHYRLYGRDYPLRLQEEGFSIRDADFAGNLPESDKSRFRLPAGEFMFACYK